MKLINKYKRERDVQEKKKILNEIKDEIKNIFLIEKLEPFAISAFLNTWKDKELIRYIEECEGLEGIKITRNTEPEKIIKPLKIDNFNKAVNNIISIIDDPSDKTIAFSSDFDMDGMLSQIEINILEDVLVELDISGKKIINIEAENKKGRGVSQSELEHKHLKDISSVDLFITADSNFDKDSLKSYKLPKNLENTTFIVTDHHHTDGKKPTFLPETNEFYEVNPQRSENKKQVLMSGAATIGLIIKEVIKRKEESGIFFNTESIGFEIKEKIDRVIRISNKLDVATKTPSIEPNELEDKLSSKFGNLFNTLNMYKRLDLVNYNSFKYEMPEEMDEEEVKRLWSRLSIEYKKIKIISKNPKIDERVLLNQLMLSETEDITSSEIHSFLFESTKSFIDKKVGGRHKIYTDTLESFKQTTKEIQSSIKKYINLKRIVDEKADLTIKNISSKKGYKLQSLAEPDNTETSIGFRVFKDNDNKIEKIGIVGGRSGLKKGDKEGWELFKSGMDKNIKIMIEKTGVVLSEKNKIELEKMVVFAGHGAAFGGSINIPNFLKKQNFQIEGVGGLLNIIKDSIITSIRGEKEKIKPEEKNVFLLDDNNIEQLSDIMKMYQKMNGFKNASSLPRIVLKITKDFKYNEEKSYQSMSLFSGESIITNGELNPGDYVEFQFSNKSLMMSRKVQESEAKQLRKYNNGKKIESPHVMDLMNVINDSEKYEKTINDKDYRKKYVKEKETNKNGVFFNEKDVKKTGIPKISLDIETTGSNSETSDIYNIGIVVDDGEGKMRLFSIFINAALPLSSIVLTRISQGFIDKHGIDGYDKIDNILSVIIKEEVDRIKKEDKKVQISAHNGMNFDFRMLEHKLPQFYNITMENDNVNLVDTTYLARKAMSEEYGLEIKLEGEKNIIMQDNEYIDELNFKKWLRSENRSEKLYNLTTENSYFTIEKGMDKQKRLIYINNGDKLVVLEDLSTESINSFIKNISNKKFNAKFSIDLITKIVPTHDILYDINKEILSSEHDIPNNIKKQNRDNFNKVIENYLEEYMFTLGKNKNVSILMDKLTNHKIETKEMEKSLENTYTRDIIEKLTENDLLSVYSDVISINQSKNIFELLEILDENNISKKEKQIIYNIVFNYSGLLIDNKMIQNEYMKNTIITEEDLLKGTKNKVIEQLKKFLKESGKTVLSNLINSKEKFTIYDLFKEIEEGRMATTTSYNKLKLYMEIEKELKREILEIQESFLKENKEKAKITEEINSILFLVTNGFLININVQEMTEKDINVYVEGLNKKMGVPKNILKTVILKLKDLKELKQEDNSLDENKIKLKELLEYYQTENHQAEKDAEDEQTIMPYFLERYYPYERNKEKALIHSFSAESKITMRKGVRDNEKKKGFERLRSKYNITEQDIYFKRNDNKEINENDHQKISVSLELKELLNIKTKKNTLFFAKEISKDLISVEIPNEMDIEDDSYSKIFTKKGIEEREGQMNPIDVLKIMKKVDQEPNDTIKKAILKENKLKTTITTQKIKEIYRESMAIKIIEGSNIQLKGLTKNVKNEILNKLKEYQYIETIDKEKIDKEINNINNNYEINYLNKEYQYIEYLRNVIDQKEHSYIYNLSNISENENDKNKKRITTKDKDIKNYMDEEIKVFLKTIPGIDEEEMIVLKEETIKWINTIVSKMEEINILSKESFEDLLISVKKELLGTKLNLKDRLNKNNEMRKGLNITTLNRLRYLLTKNLHFVIEEIKPQKQEEEEQELKKDKNNLDTSNKKSQKGIKM